MSRIGAGLFALVLAVPVLAQDRPADPLAEKVRKSIDAGKAFLIQQQQQSATPTGPGGHWEIGVNAQGRPGGWTALATLALLNCGEKPDSQVIQRALRYLREVEPSDTYVVGLQTMVFAEASEAQDQGRIQRNVDWLIRHRVQEGNRLIGWGYKGGSKTADNSNTQYALLGLWAGKSAGARIGDDIWKEIQDFYLASQDAGGGWFYISQFKTPTLTMTTAGLSGLLIAGQELTVSQQKLNEATGVAANCGVHKENDAVEKARNWIKRNFDVKGRGGNRVAAIFYNLYGIERAGRLSGLRFFGDYDWYRHGSEELTKSLTDPSNKIGQRADGSWHLPGQHFDSWPVVSTSFALLFLSKGRTPILISKLMHGLGENPAPDWNRKHNDLRHLTEYASKQVFKGQPVGWQIFNARQTGKQADDLLPELLQSPIAYLSGHNPPQLPGEEERLLQKYLDQGGFLLAEACCGSQEFDRGFRELMKRVFEDNPDIQLKRLPAEHPIWQAHVPVSPREFELWGIEQGCKTIVVYSPQPISGYWDANLRDRGRGRTAFQLAGNIIAYATGMELPKPKGVEVETVKDVKEGSTPRGFLKIAQLKHKGDWHPAPRAMRNLLAHLQQRVGLDASLITRDLYPHDLDLLNHKFMYMHGRKEFDVGDPKVLRANLETGGTLLADACCGKEAFDQSFRAMIKQMFGDKHQLEPIPPGDDLFSKELNGEKIETVRVRREREFQNVGPALEGVKINGRWAVIYSKYDLGCALEKHQSTDCRGHDHESALKLAGAALLYALQR